MPTDVGQVSRKGTVFVFGFLGIFLVWATLFPIASAVVSMGKVVSAGQNKLIQHSTGGVIQEIRVGDGAYVEKGEVLLVLDSAGNQAELTRLSARKSILSALKTRLEAEARGGDFNGNVTVSDLGLQGAQDVAANEAGRAESAASRVLAEQQIEFDAGRKRLNAELDAAKYQIESLKDQRSGLLTRLEGTRHLLEFTEMEIKKTRPLVEDGYLAKSRLWDLDKKRLEQISDQLEAVQSSINLTELRALEAGTIVKLAVHTQAVWSKLARLLLRSCLMTPAWKWNSALVSPMSTVSVSVRMRRSSSQPSTVGPMIRSKDE